MPIPADLTGLDQIRVRVAREKAEITVETKGEYEVFDENGRRLFYGKRIVPTRISKAARGIRMGPQVLPAEKLKISSEGGVAVNGHYYEGALEVVPAENGKIDAVNLLPLEEYLKGVLPKEVSSSWPAETLKAQAVAARTYAFFRILENVDNPYAVNADVMSQVYGGKKVHEKTTDEAVDATRGEILSYEGSVFPAFFHANSGGRTTRAETAFRVEAHPSLQGVDSPVSKGMPHDRWSETFTIAQIVEKMKEKGYYVSGLREIRALNRDESGRAQTIQLLYREHTLNLPSADFRLFMGPFKFKSTLLDSIERKDNAFVFKGRGWGHGVGLCQYGAKKLGELGNDYRQILQYYYPNSRIVRLPYADGVPGV